MKNIVMKENELYEIDVECINSKKERNMVVNDKNIEKEIGKNIEDTNIENNIENVNYR